MLEIGHTERRMMHVSVGGIAVTHDVTLEPLRDADGRICGLIEAHQSLTGVIEMCRAEADAKGLAVTLDFNAAWRHVHVDPA